MEKAFTMLKILLSCLMLIQNHSQVCGIFKLTNVNCKSYNLTVLEVRECRLRAINREITEFNMIVRILKPAYIVDVNAAILKKLNGYKPFLINFTIDACKYVERRNHPVANIVYNFFRNFSNINHTCPYTGDVMIKHLYPRLSLLNNLPLPNGDYALFLSWYFSKLKYLDINVYFTYDINGK